MVKNHKKRINMPRTWDVLRKEHKFISRPNPGRELSLCIPLNTALKEMIGKTRTTKESKYLLRNKKVIVNGKPRYDEKFPVGFLDVVSFPELKESYRLLINQKKKLFFTKISEEEAKTKLSKVVEIKDVSKDKAQVFCSDGRTFIFKKDDKLFKEIKTNDSILYSIPEQEPKQVLKLEKGVKVFLYKGRHAGITTAVEEVVESIIKFEEESQKYETKKAYAFVVGKDKPLITITNKTKSKK